MLLTTSPAPPPHYDAVSKIQLIFKSHIPYYSMLLMYNHIHWHSRCIDQHLTMSSVKVQHCNIVSSDAECRVTMLTHNSGHTSNSVIEIITLREER
jgi:hypothetical protein